MLKVKRVFVLCLCCMLMVGCPTSQQWFQIAGDLLPIVGQTYLQFYGFAKGGTDAADVVLVQNLTSKGQDAIKQIGALVNVIKTTKDAGKIAELNAVLAQLKQSVDSFLSDAQIKNSAHFAEYSAFANAILDDLTDFAALVPVVTTGPPARLGSKAPVTITEKVALPKAKTLKGIFQGRLASLPK